MLHKKSSHFGHLTQLARWFKTPIGKIFQQAELPLVGEMLSKNFRKEVLQIDWVGWEKECHQHMRFSHFTVIDSQSNDKGEYAQLIGNAQEMPIETHSVDIVILPHSLEFQEDPHQVLREVNRILRPEGIVLLLGFNPWAIWHLPRFLPRAKNKTPWNGRFISRSRVIDWLKLLNFSIDKNQGYCFFPLVHYQPSHQAKIILESIAAWFPVMPAAYFLVGVKRVTGSTPIFHLRDIKERFISPIIEPTNKTSYVKKENKNIH